MLVPAARTEHPEAREVVASTHCVVRFRQRSPFRTAGSAEVLDALRDVLEAADVSGWPPGWAATGPPARLWAVAGDLAFPLEPTGLPGRWVAVTCLRRGRG